MDGLFSGSFWGEGGGEENSKAKQSYATNLKFST